MADYECSATVDAPADELFEYLSKIENLPAYMDRMTSVRNLPGDEVEVEAEVEPGDSGTEGGPDADERTVAGDAWFRIDADSKTLAWGSEGQHDYRGELQVVGDGTSSTVTVRLHTQHEAGPNEEGIEDGIERTLANIQRLAGSEGELNPGAGTS